jgi:hypothetical protein
MYREGQRVRIEWPGGSVVEGVLQSQRSTDLLSVVVPRAGGETTLWQPDASVADGRTVTILSEPEVPEPTMMGAVVEALSPLTDKRSLYVRRGDGTWWRADAGSTRGWTTPWETMIDRVVLHEGPPACGLILASSLPCALPKGHTTEHGSACYPNKVVPT